MSDVIIIAVLLVILTLSSVYVYKSKKNGKKCIGCPGGCCSGCSGTINEEKE